VLQGPFRGQDDVDLALLVYITYPVRAVPSKEAVPEAMPEAMPKEAGLVERRRGKRGR